MRNYNVVMFVNGWQGGSSRVAFGFAAAFVLYRAVSDQLAVCCSHNIPIVVIYHHSKYELNRNSRLGVIRILVSRHHFLDTGGEDDFLQLSMIINLVTSGYVFTPPVGKPLIILIMSSGILLLYYNIDSR